jgi:hypothetical protein
MSGYINAGVYSVAGDNAERLKTKKALREAIAEKGDNAELMFDATAMEREGDIITPQEITGAMKIQVTGPDPYTSRKWYATVTRAVAGKYAGKLVVT